MKWISIKDQLPIHHDVIVAIMNGRVECTGDPIEDALIVILRSSGREWFTMDSTQKYYLPSEINDDNYSFYYYDTIQYWMPWEEFGFPRSMIKEPNEMD